MKLPRRVAMLLVDYYANPNVSVGRIITDNSSAVVQGCSARLADCAVCAMLFTRLYTPRANVKGERFVQTALRANEPTRPNQDAHQPPWTVLGRLFGKSKRSGINAHSSMRQLAAKANAGNRYQQSNRMFKQVS